MGSAGNNFLAARAASAVKAALSYWSGFQKAQEGGLWSPENPEGYISMVIAENRLSTDIVQAGLAKYATDWPASMLYYQDARGIAEIRSSFAHMLQRTIAKGVDVAPADLTVLTGAGSVLDLLLHCVAEAGDAVLIPAPYYPAFDNDLQVRNQVQPVPVHLDVSQPDWSTGLDAAAAAVRQQGKRVAAVLFTNPTNPQGLLLSRQQVRSTISWCLKNKVHCIGDEVYALSVFEPEAEFCSTLQVLQQDKGMLDAPELADDLVHALFGASKDFCGSGLRIGVLHSRNGALNAALGNLGYFCSPPAPLQMTLSKLLRNDGWLDGFLSENRRRMLDTYTTLTGALDDAHIPYTPAPAGMFLWVDLRAAFRSSSSDGTDNSTAASWQDEEELWQYLVDEHRVVLTPGAACHAVAPGFFRMCWAWPHRDCIHTAVQRLAAAVQQFRPEVQQDVKQQPLPPGVDQQQKAQQAATAGAAKTVIASTQEAAAPISRGAAA